MSDLSKLITPIRLRPSAEERPSNVEQFYSDKSRIVFCSSFRRLMQKAQVFSLETNSSVRNRLTHSLEVADTGRKLARVVGMKLHAKGFLESHEIEEIQTIVECACLTHDLGNPPFGHFGEAAVKSWFEDVGKGIHQKQKKDDLFASDALSDFEYFDGNPQGFRIVTKLHNEIDEFGLNLTAPSLLAAVKYPSIGKPNKSSPFSKKIGVFRTEEKVYLDACGKLAHKEGTRYFLAYLMELADDICYCASDIADSFEKGITSSREFKDEYKAIAKELGITEFNPIPEGAIYHFHTQVAIDLAKRIIEESSEYFVNHLDDFIKGDVGPLSTSTDSGKCLEFLKTFCRRHVYTSSEAERIEIAGSTIMAGLLNHYSKLLRIDQNDFAHFIEKKGMPKNSGLDLEWRIYNQLSERMLNCYLHFLKSGNREPNDEWILRAHLIVDYVSGLTDAYARDNYQNFMGISL